MAGELQHADVGDILTKAEWEAIATHALDGQAKGDLIVAYAAALARFAVGANGLYVIADSAEPSGLRWVAGEHPITLVAADYSVLGTDFWVGVDTSVLAIQITLPLIAGLKAGTSWAIYDDTGDAATNNISVVTPDAATINGQASDVISVGWAGGGYMFNGTNWRIF